MTKRNGGSEDENGKKSLVRPHFSIAFRHIYEVLIYLFICLFIYLFIFLDTENATIMLTKPRTVPPDLTSSPEVNLLTEFAVIATSPQNPLVREVSGENADARRREDDSPPPQLADLKQMVCDWGLGRERHMPNLPQLIFAKTSPVLGVIRKRY